MRRNQTQPAAAATTCAHSMSQPQIRSATLTHLQRLEAESIHIFREVAANFSKPVMLYSVGKDSSVLMHLAMKAFYPAKPPFPFLHVDTTWKFREMIAFRDQMAEKLGFDLLVHVNEDGVRDNINPFDHGSNVHTHIMNASHAWDPKNQRPEMWNIYNTRISAGESIRVFPLSNWTELDIWQYILQEDIPIVPLYFAKERPVVERDGMLILKDDDRMKLRPDEVVENRLVRFRTLGCYPLTGAIESSADTLEAIVGEMLTARTSERQGRLIDRDEAGSMEKKKREGYF